VITKTTLYEMVGLLSSVDCDDTKVWA